MHRGCFLALLLFSLCCCYSDLARATSQAVDVEQELPSGNATAPTASGNGEKEVREFTSLKNLYRLTPKNVATLEKSPALSKHVKFLTSNPGLMKDVSTVKKTNPVIVNRLEALEKNPRLVKERSAQKLYSYLAKDESLSNDVANIVGSLVVLALAFGSIAVLIYIFRKY
ncbi:hypothetical protein GN244_ATG09471 [Phytophthora infestans]|uniref:Secreted RxLR effector peptide protein n=1 Tax=Phytophthora infestans TaxID=4787 RepID=A0A833T7X4_PHYIN|nr:hypothetical protein GN244_ATG09471 [Phytophthora infestans]